MADAGDATGAGPPALPDLAERHAPVRIFFEAVRAEGSLPVLDAVAELRLRPQQVLRLVAHADESERRGGAMDLARRRAGEIRRYLEEHGVDTTRFIVDARGDFEPLGDTSTEEGRAANRRVDFVFERGQ